MALDLLQETYCDNHFLAKILLIQAGISPAYCDCTKSPCGCQYAVEAFDIDVFRIHNADAGQERILKVHKI